MCLASVSRTKPKKSGIGYKVLCEGKTVNRYCRLSKTGWSKAENIRIYTGSGQETYLSGFHIWETKEGAEDWTRYYSGKIKKVRYKEGRLLGKQEGYPVIIADKIKLVPEKKK
jgi:hypothetical protein